MKRDHGRLVSRRRLPPTRTLINSVVAQQGELTFLFIMCCHLAVANRGMTTVVELVVPQALGTGPPSLVGPLMGDRMLHRRAFLQRGSSALGRKLGAQLGLGLLVRVKG